MKTFDPKITPGPWEVLGPGKEDPFYQVIVDPDPYKKYEEFILNAGECVAYDISHLPNAHAIAAVPELLEVYDCAKTVVESGNSVARQYAIESLKKCIKALEERHGVES